VTPSDPCRDIVLTMVPWAILCAQSCSQRRHVAPLARLPDGVAGTQNNGPVRQPDPAVGEL
jgi:hypothetical protein